MARFVKGSHLSPETRAKISATLKARGISPEMRAKLSAACKGVPKPARTDEHKRNLSKSCKGVPKPKSLEHRRNLSKAFRGAANANWNGGSSLKGYSGEFNEGLRQRIRERDNYICQKCGAIDSRDVHHVNRNKSDSRLGNLLILCHACHTKVHKGRGAWTWQVSNEYELVHQAPLPLKL